MQGKEQMKKLSDYLPSHKDETTVLVQANIDKALHKKVKALLPKTTGWTDFVTAACKLFIDENAKSQKK